MNRRIRLMPAALIATCAMVAVACRQKSGVHVASGWGTRNPAGEVVIGIHGPATGAGAPAQSFNDGRDVYFNYLGPINGRKVRVVFADDGYNPGQAVSACKKMVHVDHVFMLIGGAGTDQIVACAQYANSVGVPYFAEGVTEAGVNKLQD